MTKLDKGGFYIVSPDIGKEIAFFEEGGQAEFCIHAAKERGRLDFMVEEKVFTHLNMKVDFGFQLHCFPWTMHPTLEAAIDAKKRTLEPGREIR